MKGTPPPPKPKITKPPEFMSTQLNTCVFVANNNADVDDDDGKGDNNDINCQ